jgi:succinate dehydrogenase / fumarate reductase cytochrome b subunit
MSKPTSLVASSVGKKIAMAVSGVLLVGFVIFHMYGNLKVYQGAEAFNHYAEGLRTVGAPIFGRGHLLWIARAGLIIAFIIHVWAALLLTVQSRAARNVGYRRYESLVFSYASRTMVSGGLILLAFVIYHLMHMTFGNAHPDFIHGDAYHNFVTGFRSWPVAIAYIVAMIALGFHLYHGIWSAFQTLGADHAWYVRLRRPLAALIALALVVGNISFPIAVLAGVVR